MTDTEIQTTNVVETEEKPVEVVKPKSRRGFASMDRSRVSEIASKGGKAAHAAGTAHQFTKAEAREAGKKGGAAPHIRRGRAKGTVAVPETALAVPTVSSETVN